MTNVQQVTLLPEQIQVLMPQEGHSSKHLNRARRPTDRKAPRTMSLPSFFGCLVSEPPEVSESDRTLRTGPPNLNGGLPAYIVWFRRKAPRAGYLRSPRKYTETFSKTNRSKIILQKSGERKIQAFQAASLLPAFPFLNFIMWAKKVRRLTSAFQFHFIPLLNMYRVRELSSF